MLLGLILALAAALRIHDLGRKCFWIDELFTLESITQGNVAAYITQPWNTMISPAPRLTHPGELIPWWRLLRADPQDIHPPLYYVLARGWASVLGFGEVGVRSLSVISSLLSVVLLWAVVRRLSGPGAGLWAAAIMAAARAQIESAQEARSYALMLAVALWACLALVRIEQLGATTRRCVALGAALAAMLFVHYFAAVGAVVLGLYAAIRLRGGDRRRTLITCVAAAAVFIALCGPSMFRQRLGASGSGTTVFVDEPRGHVLRTFGRAASLPGEFLSPPQIGKEHLGPITAVICILPLFMLRRRPDLLLWTLWAPLCIAPAVAIDLVAGSSSLNHVRYTILASPAVYALLAAVTSQLRIKPLRHALPALAVLAGAATIGSQTDELRPDWRRLGEVVAGITRPGDVMVVNMRRPNARQSGAFLVLGIEHYAWPLPGPVLLLDRTPSLELQRELGVVPAGIVVVGDWDSPDSILPASRETAARYYPPFAEVHRLAPDGQP
jgi:4-amino-4-deoxy-L-arabinose transferase-like glycosyltransferase